MTVTIVMYHYVRDFRNTRYPRIRGLDVSKFKEQLRYFSRFYEFISTQQLIDAINLKSSIAKNSILLTFDDAYQDHYRYVYPILKEMGISGAFYTSSKAIYDHTILDVNKIHFVLASGEIEEIINALRRLVALYSDEYGLQSFNFYYQKLSTEFLYDDKETMFIKRLLQYELPLKARRKILDELYCEFVGVPESVFSEELYMTLEQVRHMSRDGMHIGSHGHNHYWLNKLSAEEQEEEIKASLRYLREMQVNMDNWTICYPYGGYNHDTIKILSKYNCQLGFADDAIDIADLRTDNRFALPRLDTNDFPCDANAPPNLWTQKVLP